MQEDDHQVISPWVLFAKSSASSNPSYQIDAAVRGCLLYSGALAKSCPLNFCQGPPQWYILNCNIACRPRPLPLSVTSLNWKRSRRWPPDLCLGCSISATLSSSTVSNYFPFGEGGCREHS